MKKVKIENRLYDVVSAENVNEELNRGARPGEIAVQFGEVVLPYLGQEGTNPGFYATNIASYPIISQEDKYSSSGILDFDKGGIRELMDTNRCLRELENDIISSSENVYVPQITSKDTPEMVGMRTAITEKHIDLDKYQDRFGASFNNDKRIINNANSITFTKLKSICDNLDIKLTLTIGDKQDAPNPIGRDIVVPLNYIDEDDD